MLDSCHFFPFKVSCVVRFIAAGSCCVFDDLLTSHNPFCHWLHPPYLILIKWFPGFWSISVKHYYWDQFHLPIVPAERRIWREFSSAVAAITSCLFLWYELSLQMPISPPINQTGNTFPREGRQLFKYVLSQLFMTFTFPNWCRGAMIIPAVSSAAVWGAVIIHVGWPVTRKQGSQRENYNRTEINITEIGIGV